MVQTLLLKNARIIDGNGGEPAVGQPVLVRDGRIAEIGPAASLATPSDATEIDLSGRTLLPGFIDCHVHIMGNPDPRLAPRPSNVPIRDDAYIKSRSLLQAVGALRSTLDAGFTTIRDLCAPNEIFALRDSIAAGETVGPRMLASGKGITHTGGHGTEYGGMAIVADGPDEVFKAIRYQAVAGADVIKIIGGSRPALSPPFRGRPGYTSEELIPGVEEAHRAGLKVAAHAHSHTEAIKYCIRAGVDSIEHGFPLDEVAADEMAERGTFLCPTLSVIPAAALAIEEGLWTYPGSEVQVKRMEAYARNTIRLAKQAGVKIALATDSAMPLVFHGDNAHEFELMVEYGLTPMEAIVAGTRNAAENIGLLDDIGTIETGKSADLVAFNADPLDDISTLRDPANIAFVLKEGKVVKSGPTTG